ncbi:hypothetical protein ICN84_12280 [Akkermansia glycaniphila]|uniref:hypothetical protein n=1 Tax=Akkermansia glycaniphila TaxID=1679444 RepID=UPI001C00E2B7|nr:hypothetical protein [Akkermansia glycaniphila]MBT9450843.1 hypothetical protein [Akkermansia glycaniphila]
MNIHTTLMLGCTAVAVSSAFGAERAAESKVAPDIAEVRQILGHQLLEKAENALIDVLDDATLQIFGENTTFIVKVGDGILSVKEYDLEVMWSDTKTKEYKDVNGRKRWVGDEGWIVRKQYSIPSNVNKDSLRQIRERVLKNMVFHPDLVEKGRNLELTERFTFSGDDRMEIRFKHHGFILNDMIFGVCTYRDGKWMIDGWGG